VPCVYQFRHGTAPSIYRGRRPRRKHSPFPAAAPGLGSGHGAQETTRQGPRTARGLFSRVNPPRGIYMWQETARLGGIERIWVPLDAVSPHVPRALVAAEDANFCAHWGFDMNAIRR
jgi:hypothetical protein